MKIIYITAEIPDLQGGGSQRRAALHLRALQRLGDVTLIVPPLDGRQPPSGVHAIYEREPTLAEDRTWRYEGCRSSTRRVFHALRKLNNVNARARPADRVRFRAVLDKPYDLIFAFRLRSIVWWESIFGLHAPSNSIRVVDLDDIESVVFEKRIKDVSHPFWKWKLARELAWLKKTERRVARQWDAFCQCSEIDVARMKAISGRTAWQIPNGYDFEPIAPETASSQPTILFVGTLSYFPNAQGIEWFVKHVWPRVRTALSDQVNLAIVGLRPTPELSALNGVSGITVTANAPSVAPHYHDAQIVIAPLQAGSGTRIKLIEAAALGRAIVTTSLGCEGLGFVDGVHAEIADDPIDFANRVVALALDHARRSRLADAARSHAIRAFSADTVTATLENNIQALIHGAAAGFDRNTFGGRDVNV